MPFHSPLSFFLPNVASLTTSISKVKFNRSARSTRISTQKPTNFCVEFEPFGSGKMSSSIGHWRFRYQPHLALRKAVPNREKSDRWSISDRECSTYKHGRYFQRLILNFFLSRLVIFAEVSMNFQPIRFIRRPIPILNRSLPTLSAHRQSTNYFMNSIGG